MTEILEILDQVKQYLKNDESWPHCEKTYDELEKEINDHSRTWLSSLITTIESQKEEIENQIDINIKQDSLITHLKKQLKESQAITELAVKGLEHVNLIYTGWNSDTASKDMYLSALQTISTIKRLSNVQT